MTSTTELKIIPKREPDPIKTAIENLTEVTFLTNRIMNLANASLKVRLSDGFDYSAFFEGETIPIVMRKVADRWPILINDWAEIERKHERAEDEQG